MSTRRAFLLPLLVPLVAACATPVAAGVGTRSELPVDRSSMRAPADTGTIRVSSSASVSVEADRARLVFAVENEAPEAERAARENATAISRAIEAVRQAAGEGHEVETRGYALRPVYDEVREGNRSRREVVAFRATNSLVVTLRDLDRVGPTLDAAIGAGANRIDGIQFFAADTREAYLRALEQAVSEALEEAEVIAGATGDLLGEVIEVQSSSSHGYEPVRAMALTDMQEAGTPVEPGSQSVSASVTLHIRLLGR